MSNLGSDFVRKNGGHGAESSKRCLFLLAVFLGYAGAADPLFGRGLADVVTNLDDSGPGSLREEIATARAGDTISFAVGGTIILTNGELLISKNLKIAGPGATNLAISAGTQSRVLEIYSNAVVNISGLSICDGRAADGAAGTLNSPVGGDGSDGGGIYNAGSLTIAQCIISNCAAGNGGMGCIIPSPSIPDATNWTGGAGGRGGALYNAGKLLLSGSRLTSNSGGAGGHAGSAGTNGAAGISGGGGGAIYNSGAMILAASSFEHNATGNGGDAGYSFAFGTFFDGGNPGGTGGDGGAVCDAGQTTTVISDCQFSFNISGTGGLGSAPSPVSLSLQGGSGGSGGGGGAIWAGGTVQMNNCTFLFNQTGAGRGGGAGVNAGGAGGAGGSGAALCSMGELNLKACSCASNHTGVGGDGGTSYTGQSGSGGSGGLGGAVYATSALRLKECAFTGNLAGGGGNGGSTQDSTRSYPVPGVGGMGGSGGAVYCESGLGATNCTFDSNQAGFAGMPGLAGFNSGFNGQPTTSGSYGGEGGGIFGAGPLVLHACTISANVGGSGSSADRVRNFNVNLSSSIPRSEGLLNVKANPNIIIYTQYGGPGGAGGTGGIYSENSLKAVLCTVSENVGGAGGNGGYSGGGYFEALSGGGGGAGGQGAINCMSSDELLLVACTIAGNRGGAGGQGGSGTTYFSQYTGQGRGGTGGAGGIFNANMNPALASVINTIVALNFGGAGGADGPYRGSSANPGSPDLQGSFTSLGYNLIGEADGSSGFTNDVNGDLAGSTNAPLDPVLGPLADNGGPTFTKALLHGSPALDAGDDALLQPLYGLKTDQRGFPRRSGPRVDIGAFEFRGQGPHAPAHPIIVSGTLVLNGGLQPNTAESSAYAAPCYQLTFSDNTPGATFSVLATTDVSLPLNHWSVLGQPVQISPGVFKFTDVDAPNNPQRFYRVSSP